VGLRPTRAERKILKKKECSVSPSPLFAFGSLLGRGSARLRLAPLLTFLKDFLKVFLPALCSARKNKKKINPSADYVGFGFFLFFLASPPDDVVIIPQIFTPEFSPFRHIFAVLSKTTPHFIRPHSWQFSCFILIYSANILYWRVRYSASPTPPDLILCFFLV